jgi:hypothetical protein
MAVTTPNNRVNSDVPKRHFALFWHAGYARRWAQRRRRDTLPEISRFLGIIIAMYYNDHAPPHFHARYGDFEAVIAIDTGEVVEGRLPPRVLGLVQEWREHRRGELTEDWNLARERKALKRIEPLE